MKTILAMGQSNMVGSGLGGAWNIPASVTVWNCAGNSSSPSSGLGNAFVTPSSMAEAPFIGRNNLAVHACRYLAHELGEDIRLIVVACAGYAISNWINGAGVTGSMYARMEAVLAAAGVTKPDAFLWHQGEADAAISGSYTASWNALLSRMTADGYLDADTPIVIGELGIWQTSMNPVLRSIADASDRIALADISCFPISAGDMHFTGASLVRAGCEYARELIKLPSQFFSPTWPWNDDVYVTAPGGAPYTTSLSTPTKILLKAENGKKSLIQLGAFVADRLGVWAFSVRGCAYASGMSVMLLDEAGCVIQYIAGTGAAALGSQSPYINGEGLVALGCGDKVFLGVVVASGGSAASLDAVAATLSRMTVRYMGRD